MNHCLQCAVDVGPRAKYCSGRCRSAYRRANGTHAGKKITATYIKPPLESANTKCPDKLCICRGSFWTEDKGHGRSIIANVVLEECFYDDCAKPSSASKLIEHPDLKKIQLTLRVALCKDHKHLLEYTS